MSVFQRIAEIIVYLKSESKYNGVKTVNQSEYPSSYNIEHVARTAAEAMGFGCSPDDRKCECKFYCECKPDDTNNGSTFFRFRHRPVATDELAHGPLVH